MKKFTDHINESIKIGMGNYNVPIKVLENYWIESLVEIYRSCCNYNLESLLYVLESLSKGREVKYDIDGIEFKYKIKGIFVKLRSLGAGIGVIHYVYFENEENEEIEIPQDIKLEFNVIDKKRIYSVEDPYGEEDWNDD